MSGFPDPEAGGSALCDPRQSGVGSTGSTADRRTVGDLEMPMNPPARPLREHRLVEAVTAIYDSVLDPRATVTALDRIGSATGADYVHQVSWDRGAGRVLEATDNGDDIRAAFNDYTHYYGAIDPRRIALGRHPVGHFYRCHQHIDAAQVARSEFYQDFYLKHGLRWASATRFAADDGIDTLFALVRRVGREPLDDETIADAGRLVGHLKRAARLRSRLAALSGIATDAAGLLDLLPLAGLLIDGGGQWLARNGRSHRPLEELGIEPRGRYLRFRVPAQQLAWMNTVQAVARDGLPASLRLETLVGAAWIFHLIPFVRLRRASDATDARLTLAVLEPVALALDQSCHLFAARHRLTEAEASVLAELCSGADPATIASRRNRSRATVRTQLASIFGKVGVTSQRDLVLALRGRGGLDGGHAAASRPAGDP